MLSLHASPEPTLPAASIRLPDDASATIADLEARVKRQALTIRKQATALAHARRTFENAAATARIGVWECTLGDERLAWTDGVYDIFDLPRGIRVDRERTLACYTPKSAALLATLRSRAIAERSGFQMDAEIVTARGNHRWVRLTATVECVDGRPVRLFGMKQDITEEKIQLDRTRYLADFDVMTGLANRSRFQSVFAELEGGHAALLLVDLDGFKQVNDNFGHPLGDECLKQVATRIGQACRSTDFIARIGGDEFAIIPDRRSDADAIARLAQRIVGKLSMPVSRDGLTLALSASVGFATTQDCTPSDLFMRADTALYAAKAAGRNTFRCFVPADLSPPRTSARIPAAHAR